MYQGYAVEYRGTYTKASLTDTTKTFPADSSFGCMIYPGTWESEHVGLKAAGTPIMIPEPEPSSVARLTFSPGLPSLSSTDGIESPTLTIFAVV